MVKLGDQSTVVPLTNFLSTHQTIRRLQMDHPQQLYRINDNRIAIGLVPESTPTGRTPSHENESRGAPIGQRGQQLPTLRVRAALDHLLYQNGVDQQARKVR